MSQTPPFRPFHIIAKTLMDDPTILGSALSPVEQAAREWRKDLLEDLGGEAAVSAAQFALIEITTKTMLYILRIDVWIAEHGTLVNAKRRSVLPVVRERQQLVDSLARILGQLGLERRAKKIPDLASYLAFRQAALPGDGDHPAAPTPAQPAATRPPDSGLGTEGHQ